jgi:linearmycin/streptolysin S transport system permease protein
VGELLRPALVILAKDLRQRWRDRTAVLVALVVPLAIAALMGKALGGGEGFRLDLGLVTGGADAPAFESWLEGREGDAGIRLQRVPGIADAREEVAAGRLGAAVAFEAGGARVLARAEGVFAARATQGLVDRFLAERAARAEGAAPPARVAPRSPGGELRMIDYFAPSMAILFLNFGVLAGVRSLAHEKESGVLARLAAAPIPPLAVLAGKYAGLFALGLVQIAVMIAATRLLFGTVWGPPLPVAALALASVLTSVGLTSLFMALGGSAERGSLYANLAIFALAVIGGQFMPPQGLPDVFETLQRLTPNGQLLRGFVDLAAQRGSPARVVAEPLAFAVAVGFGGLAVGVRGAGRALHRAAG